MLDEDWQKTDEVAPYLVKEPTVPQNYQKYFGANHTDSALMATFAHRPVSDCCRWEARAMTSRRS